MIQVRARHLDEHTTIQAVLAANLEAEIPDAAAVTIASWWQSPGGVGATLAALASGCAVEVTDVLDDVHDTRSWAMAHGGLTTQDARALDCLSTWAIAKDMED